MEIIILKKENESYARKLVADEGKLLYQVGMEDMEGIREIVIPLSWDYEKMYLEKEIPELNEGIVILYSVARDPGSRSKIAVYSENEKVDAVGACIGEKGIRINNISNTSCHRRSYHDYKSGR